MENLNVNKSLIKKFFVDNFTITSPYFRSEKKKILVISDIHFHKHVDKNIFYLLIKKCQILNPDFILIPGDIIESDDFLFDRKEKEFLEFFIKELSLICPIIITAGNHDIGSFKSIKDRINMQKGNNTDLSMGLIKYFESWNRFKNVYFLNNQQINLSGFNFIGFSPSIMTYIKYSDLETQELFISEYINSGFKMSKDDYNVILTHSPILLTQNYVKEMLSDVNELSDLVVTGHLHDGYLPKILDKYFEDTNYGIFITPFVSPFAGVVCRGIHDYGRGYLVVSQGFRKYTADIPLFRSLEKITANDVEMLNITSGDSKQYKKVL